MICQDRTERVRDALRDHARYQQVEKETVESVKARTDIVALVEETVGEFKREGSAFLAACPRKEHGRLALKVWPDSQRWKCYACDTGGDCFDFIQWSRGVEFHTALDDLRGSTLPPPLPRNPSRPKRDHKARPPRGELQELWGRAVPVASDAAACAWCEKRSIDPANLDREGVARVAPRGARVPRWARFGGEPWTKSGHRLLFPLYDAAGEMVSLRARRVEGESERKAINPAGFSPSGSVLAMPAAVEMLRTGKRPKRIEADPLRIVIVEGDSDLASWANRIGNRWEHRRPYGELIIGVFSGAWSPEIAARVPDAAQCAVRTDPDRTGDSYAERIIESLIPRVDARRSRPETK